MSGPSDAPLMLGVSGLRGIVGKSLTPEAAVRYAAAFGSWLMEREGEPTTVLIGRDGRAGGEAIHAAAIAGLLSCGCDVIDLGVVTTPTAGRMVDALTADGAMIVTASHNPQEWNGLKCIVQHVVDREAFNAASEEEKLNVLTRAEPLGARAPSAAEANEIISRFRAGAAATVDQLRCGQLTRNDEAAAAHVAGVLEELDAELGVDFDAMFGDGRTTRVVVDSVNCSGHKVANRLFTSPAYEFTAVAGRGTGLFPHTPEPTRENLVRLCEAVRGFGADIGFAQDPDADRLAIIDERGEYIGEEYTLVLAAMALLSAPDSEGNSLDRVICTNLSTSRMIDDIAARYGARVIRTAVGEANVVEAMKREKAAGRDVILGGEGNGGVIWPQVTYVRDSLSAMALVLALMARTGKTVSQLVAEIPAYAIEKRKVDLARKEDAAPAVEKLAAAYKGQRLDRQDGIRIDFDDRRAWLHVRASNTEPIMRLIAEAPSEESARSILDEAARVIAGRA